MKTFRATDAKNEFGRLLDTAQREPVTIEKKGRPVAVIMSMEEFKTVNKLQDAMSQRSNIEILSPPGNRPGMG